MGLSKANNVSELVFPSSDAGFCTLSMSPAAYFFRVCLQQKLARTVTWERVSAIRDLLPVCEHKKQY